MAAKGNLAREIETLIKQGKSNPEIWAIVQHRYNLDAGKKHYPAWYRGKLRRQGRKVKSTDMAADRELWKKFNK